MKAAMATLADGIEIVKGANALFIKRLGTLVVGDMHIGLERKYERMGVHFEHASKADAASIVMACEKSGAKNLVLLGDVKESIGFSDAFELEALGDFFRELNDYRIMVAKGNHDGHLPQILQRIGVEAQISREILIGDFAFTHGNSIPSKEALLKKYVVAAHGHFVVRQGARLEKIFIVAKKSQKNKSQGNKSSRLILAPAFSKLVYGTKITGSTKKMMPMFRNDIYDFDSAWIIDAFGKKLGRGRTVAKEQETIRSGLA